MNQNSILYRIGDATAPEGEGAKVVAHICNDIGGWGRGFVIALSKRWPKAEASYRSWFKGGDSVPFALGQTQFVEVSDQLWVANMIAQRDTRSINGVPPIRYEALVLTLAAVAAFASERRATVHMPRIGCGLAGGSWDEVSAIIERELTSKGVQVVVYDLAP
jgi:O-acetyl-ADP-ribose deacetylase (regulator of RNase III)